MASGEVGRLLVPGAEVTADQREPLTWPCILDRNSRREPSGRGETYPVVIELSLKFGETAPGLRRGSRLREKRACPTQQGSGEGVSSRVSAPNVKVNRLEPNRNEDTRQMAVRIAFLRACGGGSSVQRCGPRKSH